MPSGRPETPMPVDMETFVSDVGYCPKCRYALTAHDFACDGIGRLVLTHRCHGKPPVPCKHVPSREEIQGSGGYDAAVAAGVYKRVPPPMCAGGCGELAKSKKAKYCRLCHKRVMREHSKRGGAQMKHKWSMMHANAG